MSILLPLLAFFLPTQFGYHFNSLATYVYGFRIDYLIPTLYLTDLLAVVVILAGWGNVKIPRKYIVYGTLYIGIAAANILHTTYYIPAVYQWLRITEMVLLAMVLVNLKKLNYFKSIFIPLSFSVVLICIVGLLQTLLGRSLGGPLYYLGERTFDINTFGVSTFSFMGSEYLRSYSTFSHPNSLSGFLFVFLIFALLFRQKLKTWYFNLVIVLVLATLLTAASLNIVVTSVMLLLIYFFKLTIRTVAFIIVTATLITLYLPKTGYREIDYRVDLARSSLTMFRQKPILGVGLNNFIPTLAKESGAFKNSWELQPVHNIYLLVLSQLGAIGLYAMCYMLYISLMANGYLLMAILFTGLFDHYWITLQQNMLMFALVISYSFGTLKKWKNR